MVSFEISFAQRDSVFSNLKKVEVKEVFKFIFTISLTYNREGSFQLFFYHIIDIQL